MIIYLYSAENIETAQLQGFFLDWPNPPSPQTHLRLLRGSDEVILALDDKTDHVVGFATAVTDGMLTAYIPLVEVLPAYRARRIGTELVRRMLERLNHLYAVDLLCDSELQPFYAACGMQPALGMRVRRYERQSGT